MPMITLRRINPARNERRFYALSVERDLLGETVLVRAWGRIGTAGRVAIEAHPNEDAATQAMQKAIGLKARRGYR